MSPAKVLRFLAKKIRERRAKKQARAVGLELHIAGRKKRLTKRP